VVSLSESRREKGLRLATKLSSLVSIVALILGFDQVDAAKDLWERKLGAIV
jgi:hypothetical protein